MYPLGGGLGAEPQKSVMKKYSLLSKLALLTASADLGQFFFCYEKFGGCVPRVCAAGDPLHHWLWAFVPDLFQADEKH